ncbi:MAG TPA: Spy/CpxP family protein refolding chaperone [Lentimicrobium sp.]|nr:Spy/CpxP family protein refolding chaperone [Lentimicrobium sp.]
MKTKRIRMIALVTGIMALGLIASDLNAQRPGRGYGAEQGPGRGPGISDDCIIPSLTEDQKTEIAALRTAHFRKAEQIRAEIGEKQARLNTLRVADKEDPKAIDQAIDDIARLKGDLMKERENHRRSVRTLLNDEQKAFYDSRPGRRGGSRQWKGDNNGPRRYRNHGMPGRGVNCPYNK